VIAMCFENILRRSVRKKRISEEVHMDTAINIWIWKIFMFHGMIDRENEGVEGFVNNRESVPIINIATRRTSLLGNSLFFQRIAIGSEDYCKNNALSPTTLKKSEHSIYMKKINFFLIQKFEYLSLSPLYTPISPSPSFHNVC
jgi:hypothetical protein